MEFVVVNTAVPFVISLSRSPFGKRSHFFFWPFYDSKAVHNTESPDRMYCKESSLKQKTEWYFYYLKLLILAPSVTGRKTAHSKIVAETLP